MLKIRLSRVGKKKQPTYRVVVADARAARDGAVVDVLGHYNPRTDPTTFVVDAARARDWLHKGAQPTERVSRLFAKEGIARAVRAEPVLSPVEGETQSTHPEAPEGTAAPEV